MSQGVCERVVAHALAGARTGEGRLKLQGGEFWGGVRAGIRSMWFPGVFVILGRVSRFGVGRNGLITRMAPLFGVPFWCLESFANLRW